MKRDLYEVLCQWKRDANRRPLLVRGARQVGKTYLVDEFGRREFSSLITLNFEKNPGLIESTLPCFEILKAACFEIFRTVRSAVQNKKWGPYSKSLL